MDYITLFQPVGERLWTAADASGLGGRLDSSGFVVFERNSAGSIVSFESYAKENSWDYVRLSIPKVSKSKLGEFPYVYLSPRYLNLKASQDLGDFADLDSACDWCRTGWVQVQKLRFSAEWLKRDLDLFSPSTGLGRPTVIVISRRLALAMEETPLRGFDLVPCVSPQEPESAAMRFETRSPELEEEAEYFQLVIQGTLPPARIGRAVPAGRCGGTCGSEFFFGESMGVFPQAAFSEEIDFYSFHEYVSDKGKIFSVSGENFVASSRFYELFHDQKFRGWAPYMTDPKISVGVVEIED